MIQVVNLKKAFKKKEILHGINLTIHNGEICGIIGNNGSGKTVLFKCICGFLHATSGQVKIDNKIVGKDIDFPKHIGIIIENPGFIAFYSGIKNLYLLAQLNHSCSKNQIKEVMKRVGLDPNNKLPVSKYSLGMRQRLGIAQAIMEQPQLLILDEPFNGLDKHGVEEIRNLLLELKKQNITIILASHNQEDINALCDRVYEMEAGYLSCVY